MNKKTYFYFNKSNNPYKTLALEEYMLENIQQEEIILYLYTHESTVVIGKNQNAWMECRHDLLKKENGKLARRISGGGAVYHDMNNLNFSFIADKNTYNLNRQLKVILKAVESFGISAEFSGRNDITANGKKFSGNAFCNRRNGAFHHGTLLINVNKTNLARYLQISADKIESRGIPSIRSSICNLTEFNPGITLQTMANALIISFEEEYAKTVPYILNEQAIKEIEKVAERNQSWEWIFGNTPKFDITFQKHFKWGNIELCFTLKSGRTHEVKIYSDAADANFIDSLAAYLTGLEFNSNVLAESLERMSCNEEQKNLVRDLISLIINKSF